MLMYSNKCLKRIYHVYRGNTMSGENIEEVEQNLEENLLEDVIE